ncbi:Uncharacterised protein [Vibrio cholerae]|nr:Uncharacterised protein [Vibrio cholerae]CSI66468.1 Uncharacterised protein [Vibrio cholerae]
MQHVEAGFISSKPCALNFHAAEATYVDFTILFTAPRTTPLFHLDHFAGCIGNKVFNNILFT